MNNTNSNNVTPTDIANWVTLCIVTLNCLLISWQSREKRYFESECCDRMHIIKAEHKEQGLETAVNKH